MAESTVTVKFNFDGETRRCNLDEPTFDCVKATIAKVFPKAPERYTVSYQDEDGDCVNIKSTDELTEAFKAVRQSTLKLNVEIDYTFAGGADAGLLQANPPRQVQPWPNARLNGMRDYRRAAIGGVRGLYHSPQPIPPTIFNPTPSPAHVYTRQECKIMGIPYVERWTVTTDGKDCKDTEEGFGSATGPNMGLPDHVKTALTEMVTTFLKDPKIKDALPKAVEECLNFVVDSWIAKQTVTIKQLGHKFVQASPDIAGHPYVKLIAPLIPANSLDEMDVRLAELQKMVDPSVLLIVKTTVLPRLMPYLPKIIIFGFAGMTALI